MRRPVVATLTENESVDRDIMPFPVLSEWRIEALRFTAFGPAILPAESLNLLSRFAEIEPESKAKQSSGEYIESGSYKGGSAEIKALGNRIDVLWNAVGQSMMAPPSVGQLSDDMEPFFGQCIAFLESLEISPIRLAVGGVAHCTTLGRDENNALIKGLVPFLSFEPSAIRDFAIQFNVRKFSTASQEIEVNRLLRLQSIQFRPLMVAVETQIVPQEIFATRVEFDYNTASESVASVPTINRGVLIRELCDDVLRFFREGLQ